MSGEITRSDAPGILAPGTVVRVIVPPDRSVRLGGGISLREGEEVLGLVRGASSKEGRVKYDIHSFGLTEALSDDGSALEADLARSLALSMDHAMNVPKSWVSEEEVDNLTARFDAALARRAAFDVLLAHQRPSVVEGKALLDRLHVSPTPEKLVTTEKGPTKEELGFISEDEEERTKRKRVVFPMGTPPAATDEFTAAAAEGIRDTHLCGLDPFQGVSRELLGRVAQQTDVLHALGCAAEAPLPSVRTFKVK